MKKYISPVIEVVEVKNADVITSSLPRPDYTNGEKSSFWGLGVGIGDLKNEFFD